MNQSFLCVCGLLSVGCQGFSNPSRKTWWSKRVRSDQFHTAGRLTAREIKYASEAGFETLISLFTYDDDVGNPRAADSSYLPNSARSRDIAERQCAVGFHVVLEAGDTAWSSLAAVRRLHVFVRQSRKPVLFFSNSSYAATFLLLTHFANVTARGDVQPGEPTTSGRDVLTTGAELGFRYDADDELLALMAEILGDEGSVDGAVDVDAHVRPERWHEHYWRLKPVYGNVFITGQIRADHLLGIEATGVTTIVNSRRGLTNPVTGAKSQEEVTLLNIRDRTGTYIGEGRQSIGRLESNRIDPNKPNVYISPSSLVNYEMTNTAEFGDSIGYNEIIERNTINRVARNINYLHLPIGGRYGYDKVMWNAYKDKLPKIGRAGVLLFKCRTGHRSGTLAILWSAFLYCFNSSWALNRAKQIGYDLARDDSVRVLYEQVLDERSACEPLGNSSPVLSTLPIMSLMCQLLYKVVL